MASAHKRYPDKTIILKGVDSDLFWNGLYDRPQRVLGWQRLYLTEDTQKALVRFPEMGSIGDRFLPDAVALEALRAKEAVVYDASQFPLRNVTSAYLRMLTFESQITYPHIIDAGIPSFAKFRTEGWFSPTQGGCWSGKRASVEMRGPVGPRREADVSGISDTAAHSSRTIHGGSPHRRDAVSERQRSRPAILR